MGYTRSSKERAEENGSYFYELSVGFTVIERADGFATAHEADRAAEQAERLLMSVGYDADAFHSARSTPTMDEIMSDDELLAELMG